MNGRFRSGLITKYRYAVEQALPDFNVRVGGA